jgi:hypothetical protein
LQIVEKVANLEEFDANSENLPGCGSVETGGENVQVCK